MKNNDDTNGEILKKDKNLNEKENENNSDIEYFPLHAICSLKDVSVDTVKKLIVKHPEAVEQRDHDGLLPIHCTAGRGSVDVLCVIYEAYIGGINQVDKEGRLPIHLAAQNHSFECLEFLIKKFPEGAFTEAVTKKSKNLPLHLACRDYVSVNVINALLSSNFVSAQKTDKDGNLPMHLLLQNGKTLDRAALKALIAFYPHGASCTDCHGNLPLAIALTKSCTASIIETLLSEYTIATHKMDSFGHSPLFLALKHDAADRIVMKLIDCVPKLVSMVDPSGMLPIQMATEKERSHFIVYQLLLRDMSIDLNDKDHVNLTQHKGSWLHVVSGTCDKYYPVIQKVLSQCNQAQVVALANLSDSQGNTAYEVASPVCRYEIRVAMRLFETLEVTETKPAYSSPISETQILYGLRYSPRSAISFDCDTSNHSAENTISLDSLDDVESVETQRSFISNWSLNSIEEKTNEMRNEKGQQVVVKFTSRRDIMEREVSTRNQFRLSRLYVAPVENQVLSVHSTIQKDSTQGYCITMEGADMTLENILNDRSHFERYVHAKTLKKIGVSLLHIHERGLIHCDFGSHNIGKFGKRWKILGIGGSIKLGDKTDINRGFYFPPESVKLTKERNLFFKKSYASSSLSITAKPTYDIWAFGLLLYEVSKGKPLPIYAQKGPLLSPNMIKIGKWDDRAMKKALKGMANNSAAYNLLTLLLQADPKKRISSMREVLQHPFFERDHVKSDGNKILESAVPVSKAQDSQDMQQNNHLLKSLIESCNEKDTR